LIATPQHCDKGDEISDERWVRYPPWEAQQFASPSAALPVIASCDQSIFSWGSPDWLVCQGPVVCGYHQLGRFPTPNKKCLADPSNPIPQREKKTGQRSLAFSLDALPTSGLVDRYQLLSVPFAEKLEIAFLGFPTN